MTNAEPLAIGRPTAPLLRVSELRLWGEAEDALRAARGEADAIAEAARAAFGRERERGYAEGRAAGAEEAARLAAAAAASGEAFLRRLEADLPALVCEIVEAVLGSTPAADLVAHASRHALGRVRLGASATLRAAPGSVATLRTALAASGGQLVRLEPDPTLEEGRCVLSGEFGTIELGIGAQLRALRAALLPDEGAPR